PATSWAAGPGPSFTSTSSASSSPSGPGRCCGSWRASSPTGTSPCSTTATTAPTTGACWPASRRRPNRARSCAARSTRSPTPTRRSPTTCRCGCSCGRGESAPAGSPLDHAERPQARDARRQSGAVHDVHHGVDVLVGVGLLLGQALAAVRERDDAALLQLAAQVAAPGGAHRGVPAQPATGAVARRAEAALERPRSPDQHPARPTHVAGHEDRLPDVGVARRQLGVPGGERARGALAVDEEGGPLAVDLVLLLLRDVVRDVVDELE